MHGRLTYVGGIEEEQEELRSHAEGGLGMEVHLDWDEPPMGRDKPKQKRGRPQGRRASSPAEVGDQTGRVLAEREPEWLERLTTDPASFAAVEREVHEQARRQADLYVAGLLAKAGESPEMTQHVDRVRAAAEVPLRPPGKKNNDPTMS